MTTEEAYDAIVNELTEKGDSYLVNKVYDPNVFGNFLIAFVSQGEERSFVCDRGQLFFCMDLDGNTGCVVIFPSLREITREKLLTALNTAR